MPHHVLLLGATGLVGRELLDLLLRDASIERVRVLARRSTGVKHAKLDEHLLELDAMEQHRGLFAVDAIFCALGTTIKIAGSQERFRVVDHDYPLVAARLGKEQGAQHYLLVSSIGADVKSRAFYTRVKGEVERDVLALDYPRTTIARPSLLLGDRHEFRFGEHLFSRLSWLVPPAYKPVQARDVARALLGAAHAQTTRVEILSSARIRA
ncbi:MAG TPA: NAD(P)H-binding protein [Thermoanaerobaculia bacterium]|nr:NAD(P)H-binding protein [Thermoanaerobaculia bacterium]